MTRSVRALSLLMIFTVSSVLSQDYQLVKEDSIECFVNFVAHQSHNERLEQNPKISRVLRVMNGQELRIVRNTFFARGGYKFETQDLLSYFEGFDWYAPSSTKIVLDSLDEFNIQYLKSLETDEERRFKAFLSSFETKNLPINISKENRLRPSYDEKGLDVDFIARYLDQSTKLYNRLNYDLPPEAGQFIAWFKIIKPRFILICYLNSMPAGGYLDVLYFATFTTAGKLISKEKIGGYSAGGLRETQSNIVVADDLHVEVEDIYIKLNDFEEEEGSEITEKSYKINDDGKIDLIGEKETDGWNR